VENKKRVVYCDDMQTLFPDILFLGPFFAPALLRITVGLYFLLHALLLWKRAGKKERVLSGEEGALALLLLAGVFTQLVAVFGIATMLFRDVWLGEKTFTKHWQEKILAIGMLLALIITGAGAFAFDLPY